MRGWVAVLVLSLLWVPWSATGCAASSSDGPRIVRHRPARTTVVLHRGWPLRRPPRVVVLHPRPVRVRVMPTVYLPPIVFVSVIVVDPPRGEALVWEDNEWLVREDDWSEVVLDCDATGHRLWLEVQDGRVQMDWAEIVFVNGDTQVVDFGEHTQDPGMHPLLEFREGRRVDHVRVVVRARSKEANLILRLQR